MVEIFSHLPSKEFDNSCKDTVADIDDLKVKLTLIKPEPMDMVYNDVFIPDIKWQLDSKIHFKKEVKQEFLKSIANTQKLTYREFQQTLDIRMNQKSNNKSDLVQDVTTSLKLGLIFKKEAIKLISNDCIVCCDRNANAKVECQIHKELYKIHNVPNPRRKRTKSAFFSTPDMLKIGFSRLQKTGAGVFTLKSIEKGDVFGPYLGDIIYSSDKNHQSGYSWEIFLDGCLHHYIDARSLKTSNWMRFVNCANTREQQSLEAIQIDKNIFYRATKNVEANEELLVFYGSNYIEEMMQLKVSKLLKFYVPGKKISSGPEKRFLCAILNNERTESNSLTDNTKHRSEDKQLKCNTTSSLIDNMMPCSEDKQLECNLLKRECKEYDVLNNDIKSDFGNIQFVCNVCNYKCKTSVRLTNHITKHAEEKVFVCKLCNLRCLTSCKFVQHMKTHTGDKLFACKLCNYTCNKSESLTYHMMTHTGENSFVCKLCDFKGTYKSHLTQHMRRHTGEKPFVCELCNKRFTAYGSLTQHMRRHSGKKPFVCHFCNFRCNQSGNLAQHIKTHSGEKPFVCKYCNFKFTQSSHLTQHIRIHTGEKPFNCKICDYRCAQASHLTCHTKTHWRETILMQL